MSAGPSGPPNATIRTESKGATGCKMCREPKRVLQRSGICLSLPHDVERGPVRRRREHGLEPGGHGDALVESQELRRDLSLVVVHHHDAVELAALRAEKDGVGRDWTDNANPLTAQPVDRGPDDADLVDFIGNIASTPEKITKLMVDNPTRLYWSN